MIVRGRYIEALAAIHVRIGRPQDLTDDELREFGLMDDLVKRLREVADKMPNDDASVIEEAADRIEQLERELADWKAREGATANAFMQAQADLKDARDQLAAEKALADRLWQAVPNAGKFNDHELVAAYRKARGL